ncbi:hypothetical protein QJQ45_019528, partial [Haematococcus lacustris]
VSKLTSCSKRRGWLAVCDAVPDLHLLMSASSRLAYANAGSLATGPACQPAASQQQEPGSRSRRAWGGGSQPHPAAMTHPPLQPLVMREQSSRLSDALPLALGVAPELLAPEEEDGSVEELLAAHAGLLLEGGRGSRGSCDRQGLVGASQPAGQPDTATEAMPCTQTGVKRSQSRVQQGEDFATDQRQPSSRAPSLARAPPGPPHDTAHQPLSPGSGPGSSPGSPAGPLGPPGAAVHRRTRGCVSVSGGRWEPPPSPLPPQRVMSWVPGLRLQGAARVWPEVILPHSHTPHPSSSLIARRHRICPSHTGVRDAQGGSGGPGPPPSASAPLLHHLPPTLPSPTALEASGAQQWKPAPGPTGQHLLDPWHPSQPSPGPSACSPTSPSPSPGPPLARSRAQRVTLHPSGSGGTPPGNCEPRAGAGVRSSGSNTWRQAMVLAKLKQHLLLWPGTVSHPPGQGVARCPSPPLHPAQGRGRAARRSSAGSGGTQDPVAVAGARGAGGGAAAGGQGSDSLAHIDPALATSPPLSPTWLAVRDAMPDLSLLMQQPALAPGAQERKAGSVCSALSSAGQAGSLLELTSFDVAGAEACGRANAAGAVQGSRQSRGQGPGWASSEQEQTALADVGPTTHMQPQPDAARLHPACCGALQGKAQGPRGYQRSGKGSGSEEDSGSEPEPHSRSVSSTLAPPVPFELAARGRGRPALQGDRASFSSRGREEGVATAAQAVATRRSLNSSKSMGAQQAVRSGSRRGGWSVEEEAQVAVRLADIPNRAMAAPAAQAGGESLARLASEDGKSSGRSSRSLGIRSRVQNSTSFFAATAPDPVKPAKRTSKLDTLAHRAASESRVVAERANGFTTPSASSSQRTELSAAVALATLAVGSSDPCTARPASSQCGTAAQSEAAAAGKLPLQPAEASGSGIVPRAPNQAAGAAPPLLASEAAIGNAATTARQEDTAGQRQPKGALSTSNRSQALSAMSSPAAPTSAAGGPTSPVAKHPASPAHPWRTPVSSTLPPPLQPLHTLPRTPPCAQEQLSCPPSPSSSTAPPSPLAARPGHAALDSSAACLAGPPLSGAVAGPARGQEPGLALLGGSSFAARLNAPSTQPRRPVSANITGSSGAHQTGIAKLSQAAKAVSQLGISLLGMFKRHTSPTRRHTMTGWGTSSGPWSEGAATPRPSLRPLNVEGLPRHLSGKELRLLARLKSKTPCGADHPSPSLTASPTHLANPLAQLPPAATSGLDPLPTAFRPLGSLPSTPAASRAVPDLADNSRVMATSRGNAGQGTQAALSCRPSKDSEAAAVGTVPGGTPRASTPPPCLALPASPGGAPPAPCPPFLPDLALEGSSRMPLASPRTSPRAPHHPTTAGGEALLASSCYAPAVPGPALHPPCLTAPSRQRPFPAPPLALASQAAALAHAASTAARPCAGTEQVQGGQVEREMLRSALPSSLPPQALEQLQACGYCSQSGVRAEAAGRTALQSPCPSFKLKPAALTQPGQSRQEAPQGERLTARGTQRSMAVREVREVGEAVAAGPGKQQGGAALGTVSGREVTLICPA